MGKKRFLMVSFENEDAVNQIYMRRNLLEDHPYMHNVYITRDLPRSERRDQKASNMLNEASQSGRSTHTRIPMATLADSNDRPNTIGQIRATTGSSETISGGENGPGLGDNVNTSTETITVSEGVNSSGEGENENTSTTRNNESPTDTLRDGGEPSIQQTGESNGERGNLGSTGQILENEVGGIPNVSNSSGNEGEEGPEVGS